MMITATTVGHVYDAFRSIWAEIVHVTTKMTQTMSRDIFCADVCPRTIYFLTSSFY